MKNMLLLLLLLFTAAYPLNSQSIFEEVVNKEETKLFELNGYLKASIFAGKSILGNKIELKSTYAETALKTKINLMIAFLFLGITSLIAQDFKTEKFKVYGNCGMCEKRIEKAASSVDGVSKADWDK